MSKPSRFVSLFTVMFSTAALAFGLAACSGGEGGSDGGHAGSFTLDDICDKFAKKECAAAKPCCESSGIDYDRVACEATARAECEEDVDSVRDGDRTFSARRADACLADIQASYAKCFMTGWEALAMSGRRLLCMTIFGGTVAEGGACQDWPDCKQPSDPSKVAMCDYGTNECFIRPLTLGEGEACSIAGYPACTPGLFCDTSVYKPGIGGVCSKPKAVGAACEGYDYRQCGVGNICNNPSGRGTCVAAKANGEDCSWDYECASTECINRRCGKRPVVNELTCNGRSYGM